MSIGGVAAVGRQFLDALGVYYLATIGLRQLNLGAFARDRYRLGYASERQHKVNLCGLVDDRYKVGNPGALLPFNAPQILIQGTNDGQIPPELPSRWAEMSTWLGDRATVTTIPLADHFDVVDPESQTWRIVRNAERKVDFS